MSPAILFGVGVVVTLLVVAYGVMLAMAQREDDKRRDT